MSDVTRELLVVLDLETTGLDPAKDDILEIAFIVVDNATLEEIGRFETVVVPRSLDLLRMHSAVVDMHTKNGLFADVLSRGANCSPASFALSRACTALLETAGLDERGNLQRGTRLILTGNTVHFDRSFLKVHAPDLEKYFYHRHADVSAARTVLGAKAPGVDVAHRAMADCEMSLAELRALRSAYAKATT